MDQLGDGGRLARLTAGTLVLAATLMGCGDEANGPTCGAGTVLSGTMCVPAGSDAGLTCGAGTVMSGGMCVSAGEAGVTITCGPGTTLVGGACVAGQPDGGAQVSCGAGTVQGDGGACVPTPAGPSIDSVSVDHLVVSYNETVPMFVGNPLPLRLGITSRAARPPSTPARTKVVVSLIEHFAGMPTTAQAMALRQCIVGSFIADLSGSGNEQVFTPQLIIPQECAPTGATPTTFNVAVSIDDEREVLPESASAAFTFTEAMRAGGSTAMCRGSFNAAAAADGCVHQLRVDRSPGTDIEPKVEPSSRLAIFWLPTATTAAAPPREMMSILVDERAYGRDPYIITSDPAASTLPGTVAVSVRMSPATGPLAGTYLPLLVESPTAGSAPTMGRTVSSLSPASDNRTEYTVFPSPAVLTAVEPGGSWTGVDEFIVETCLTPSFTEAGNEGEFDDSSDGIGGPSGAARGNCRRTTVLGVRALPSSTTASRLDLNRDWSNRWGNEKLALNASLTTQTGATVGGASTDTNANVTITSEYLPDITIARARAWAAMDLFNLDASGIELSVDVLGERLYSFERRVPGSRDLYMRDWNIMRRQCRSKTVMISIVPVSVEACAQGTVGLEVNLGLYRDGDVMEGRRFPMADTEAQLLARARPYANAGASMNVAINLGVARGGVDGTLNIVDLSAPLVASANVGLTRMNEDTMRPSAQATFTLTWNRESRGLNGNVTVYADTRGVRWCRRWGVSYPCGLEWNRRGDFNLFSYGADPERTELLNREFRDVSLAP